jgi:hypothetical protein
MFSIPESARKDRFESAIADGRGGHRPLSPVIAGNPSIRDQLRDIFTSECFDTGSIARLFPGATVKTISGTGLPTSSTGRNAFSSAPWRK